MQWYKRVVQKLRSCRSLRLFSDVNKHQGLDLQGQGQGLHIQGQTKDLRGKATILELGAYAFYIGLFQYCELFVVHTLIKCFFSKFSV